MSAAAEVAVILLVFFLSGIIVGIIAVIAIPARSPTRRLAARTGQDRPRYVAISPPGQSRQR
jgi:hypothetical protein